MNEMTMFSFLNPVNVLINMYAFPGYVNKQDLFLSNAVGTRL